MSPALPVEVAELLRAQDRRVRERCWARLLERYNGLLLYAARRFGPDYDQAMDRYGYLLEELQRDDYKRLRAYAPDGPGKFTTWLLVVAYRLCRDFHRREYGRRRNSDAESEPVRTARAVRRRLRDFVFEQLDPTLAVEPNGRDPESRLRAAELGQALARALGSLSPSDRLLLQYRFEDDRSVAEITGLLRLPSVFHCHRRLKKVLGQVRRHLETAGHDTPVF